MFAIMSKWIAEALALVLSMGAITPLHGEAEAEYPMGQKIVLEVEKSFRKGKYDTFLSQLDEQYQRAGKIGALRGVYQNAKKGMPSKVLSNMTTQDHKDQIQLLNDDLKKRLVNAIAEDGDSAIAKKVDAVVYFSLDPQSRDLLAELDLLKYSIPEETESTLENKISFLQTEYYLKSLLLNVAHAKSQTAPEELLKRKIALELQKFEEMEDVVKAEGHALWLKKIQKAKQAYRLCLAYQIDYDTLKTLVPKTETEKKVKAVMDEHLKKKATYFKTRIRVNT